MGFMDRAIFGAPDVASTAVPSIQNFREWRNQDQERQMMFEKDMANFQSNLRLKEMDQAMRQQRIAKAQEPLNVLPPTGLITPAMAETFDVARDRNNLTSQNNMMRNQIAQQNADTKRDLGYETLDTRRDIAGQQIGSRESIADANNQTRTSIADRNIEGRVNLEGVRQENRVTNLNTRGNQMLNNIAASGKEARLTRAVESPNVNANNPSQQAIAEKSRANAFMNQNPTLAKHISFDPNTGMVTVVPPSDSRWSSGPTQDEYHKIIQGIYGATGGSTTPPTTTTTAPPPVTNSDKVRVRLPNGQIGMMPRSRANQPGITILGGGQ